MTIKPCPFCGGTDTTVCEGYSFRWRTVECNDCEAIGPSVKIQTCGKGTQDDWEASAEIAAYAKWNARAALEEAK